jgi:inorganic triphosphatase YgiF
MAGRPIKGRTRSADVILNGERRTGRHGGDEVTRPPIESGFQDGKGSRVPNSSALPVTAVTMIVERELRFVPVSRLSISSVTRPVWHGYRVAELPAEHQRNVYLDTATQALARQGVTFRRRILLDPATGLPLRAELTVKLPRAADGEHLFTRPEYTEPIGPDEPLAGHPLLRLAAEYAADEPIAPWFALDTDRSGVALERDGAIHLTWDRLSLPDDPDYRDEEIEAELVAGPVEALTALADLLTSTYGLEYGDNGKRTRVGRHLARQGRIAFPGVAADQRPSP